MIHNFQHQMHLDFLLTVHETLVIWAVSGRRNERINPLRISPGRQEQNRHVLHVSRSYIWWYIIHCFQKHSKFRLHFSQLLVQDNIFSRLSDLSHLHQYHNHLQFILNSVLCCSELESNSFLLDLPKPVFPYIWLGTCWFQTCLCAVVCTYSHQRRTMS